MAALIGTAFRSVLSHVGRHKLPYLAGTAALGGGALYLHNKNQQAQAEQESPMPEMSPPTGGYNTNPNQGPSYTA